MKIDIDLIKEVFYKSTFLLKYGFVFDEIIVDSNSMNHGSIEFSSNTINFRGVIVLFSLIKRGESYFHFIICSIQKNANDEGENEHTTLCVNNYLDEKNVECDKEKFLVFFENSMDFKNKIFESLNYIENLIDKNEELNKIIKGEYWEFKNIDWGLFGK